MSNKRQPGEAKEDRSVGSTEESVKRRLQTMDRSQETTNNETDPDTQQVGVTDL